MAVSILADLTYKVMNACLGVYQEFWPFLIFFEEIIFMAKLVDITQEKAFAFRLNETKKIARPPRPEWKNS